MTREAYRDIPPVVPVPVVPEPLLPVEPLGPPLMEPPVPFEPVEPEMPDEPFMPELPCILPELAGVRLVSFTARLLFIELLSIRSLSLSAQPKVIARQQIAVTHANVEMIERISKSFSIAGA
jgi:hypothetical protein